MAKTIFVGPNDSISVKNLDSLEFHLFRHLGTRFEQLGTLEEVAAALGIEIVPLADYPEDDLSTFKNHHDPFAGRNASPQTYEITPEPAEAETVRLMKVRDLKGMIRIPDESCLFPMDRIWFPREARAVSFIISGRMYDHLSRVQIKLIQLFMDHIDHADFDHSIQERIDATCEIIRRLGFKPIVEEAIPPL